MIFFKETAPHIRRNSSVTRMMVDVLIALAPTLIFAFVVFPLQTLMIYLTSIFIMVGSELLFILITKGKDHTFKEKFSINNILSALVTAVIYTLILPPGAPIYAVIVGAFAGILLGKLVFGGLGSNIFNPAAVGMIVAKMLFGKLSYPDTWYYPHFDAEISATPAAVINPARIGGVKVDLSQFSLLDMFFGRIPGTLGEVFKITILIGLIYLLIRRAVDFRIVASYLGTFIILMLFAGIGAHYVDSSVSIFEFVAYNLLSGGVLFGATFMLTDPVTSPINSPSRILYGLIAAVATVLIRLFGALPEGVAYSILIANMIAVVLDHYKWSTPRYTKKFFITGGVIAVLAIAIVLLGTMFGGIYHA